MTNDYRLDHYITCLEDEIKNLHLVITNLHEQLKLNKITIKNLRIKLINENFND